MAKAYGINGVAVGKLGNNVFSVNSGEQIVRAYQPKVTNPNTDAQQASRAKLKLASQLAAIMAPNIAMRKVGLVSRRNMFIKKNYGYITAGNGEAQISLENIQLTDSTIGFPQVGVQTRNAESGITSVRLAEDAGADIDAVVYVGYRKLTDGSMVEFGSVTTTDSSYEEVGARIFEANLPYAEGELLILAYGIRWNGISDVSKVKYDDLEALTGTDIATLVYNGELLRSQATLTQTRGVQLASDATTAEGTPSTKARVFVTASPTGYGTVAGGGTFDKGANVTVTATPADGKVFQGWKKNGSNSYVSSQASYTISDIQNDWDLIAVFSDEEEMPLTPQP